MISYQQAVGVLQELAATRWVGSEKIPLVSAIGRTLADPVLSREKVPSFDNSAMDGFAVSAEWTRGATRDRPIEIQVKGVVLAGDSGSSVLSEERTALEIMTGAPLPQGPWDAVIKIEDVAVERCPEGHARSIRVFSGIEKGKNVREAGEDYVPGQLALLAGRRISAEQLLVLATLGVAEVSVRKKPRVAVISTGKELAYFSTEKLESGKIRNSTGPFLEAAIPELGAEVKYFGVIEDSPEVFERLLQNIILDGYDLILSTGAVSMGQMDFVGDSLRRVGAEILFHKVAIRPGKPVLCASFTRDSGPIFIGLPGNPVSTAVGLRFFVAPYLRELMGRDPEPMLQAVLTEDTRKPEGLRCFFKGVLGFEGTTLRVRVLSGQASFMVSPFLRSNCWVIFSEESNQMRGGTIVKVSSLRPDVWNFSENDDPENAGKEHKECC